MDKISAARETAEINFFKLYYNYKAASSKTAVYSILNKELIHRILFLHTNRIPMIVFRMCFNCFHHKNISIKQWKLIGAVLVFPS